MKFHGFIQGNLDPIIDEWEAFASTLLSASKSMSKAELRNNCREILLAIVKDMQSIQSDVERAAKARRVPAAAETIAAAHGALRHASGFDIAQVLSEFRALRSSVLSLWRRAESIEGQVPAIEEIARFNEAIDEAAVDSVQRYAKEVATSRELFLAVLGHDLRNPLQVIQMASHTLAVPGVSDAARLQTAQRIGRVSKMMGGLIADLLEFTRSRQGRGIPIKRSACDMGQLCAEAIDLATETYSRQKFVLDAAGDLHLQADVSRMQQVLSNLLNNAVQHGDRRTEVRLTAQGEQDAIVVAVTNFGKPIPPEAVELIYKPLVQVPATTTDPDSRPQNSLGLGLYIVREIVLGHHGTIDVQSAAGSGTVFTIRLPRTDPGDLAQA